MNENNTVSDNDLETTESTLSTTETEKNPVEGETVSSGDSEVNYSISDNDSGETIVVVPSEFPPELLTTAEHINSLLSALLFFVVFWWVEDKLTKGVRRIFTNAKFN